VYPALSSLVFNVYLSHTCRYLYSTDNYVVAGALLAIGIVNCGVQNENDPAFALIYDYVSHADVNVK
jgi:26S proteasome regulatory subunit N1